MTDLARTFLDESRHLLLGDYLPKIERSLEPLSDADVWWRPNETSNSIGNLLIHLRGNVTEWMIGGVGRRPFHRDRPREFDERTNRPWRELLANLKATVAEADEVMRSLDSAALLTRHEIQDYDVTALQAIYHVVEHFGMHTGQIILLSKLRTGIDLKLWQPVKPDRS